MKVFISLFYIIFFCGVHGTVQAQNCQSCPPVFVLRDSIFCNSIDIVNNPSGQPHYQNLRPATACRNTRMQYLINTNSVCYPLITYNLISISGGTMLSLVNNQLVIQWGSTASGTILLSFTTPGSSTLPSCTDTIRLNFSLLNNPFAAFTASPQPACFSNPTTINFNSTGTLNAANYFWDFGDGFTSTLVNPSHAYTAAGTFTVSLTVTTGGFFNGVALCPDCTDSVQHTVVIAATPGPDISCVASVCAGSVQQYCTGAVACSGYNWSVTGGNITSGQNTSCISVLWGSGVPQGSINLMVTGCAAAACPQGTTVSIPVIPAIGVISGQGTVCTGSAGTYVLPSWPGTTYNWSISGGGLISPVNTNTGQITVNWFSPGNYTVNCNYFDTSLNCGGTASFNVSVLPQLSINGTNSFCVNASGSLNAVRPGNVPVPSVWSISPAGANISSGNGTGTVNINWALPGNYIVTATAVAPGVVCSNATYSVTVLPAPVLTVINGPNPVCPASIHVYTVASSGSGPFTWSVTNGAAILLGVSNDSVQVTWGSTGPYSISVFRTSFPGNCVSNTIIKNITSFPPPLLTGPLNVCADNTETYTVSNILSGNFQWSVVPPSFGTITSGQGTNTVSMKWHGNNNPGFTNTVFLHYGVCNTDSVAVVINEPQAATITASGSLCVGAGITLNTGATGIFAWSCTEHSIVPLPGNTAGITVNLPGHYSVQIQNYNGSGCTVTANYFIPETGVPVAAISANGPLSYCLPNLPNLVLAANMAPGYSYQWFTGVTPLGTGPTLAVNNLTTAGTYSYYAVVSLGTCTDTSNLITINISSCPPVPPGCSAAIGLTVSGCNPFVLGISAVGPSGAVINGSGNPTILHGEDGSVVASNTTHTYSSVGYKQIRVCADVLLPDMSVCRVCKDTVVFVTAAANFTGNIGCGSITLFNASVTVSPAVISAYAWSIGYNPGNAAVPPSVATFSSNTVPSPLLTVNQSGSYIVSQAITAGSCTIIHRDTFTVHVPDAGFIALNSCVGTPVTLNNLFPEPVNFWGFGDAATSYTSPTFHAYAVPGIYNITHIVTDINGCKDTVIKPVTIISASSCNISFAGPSTFCFGDSLILNGCGGYSNYQWFNNGVAINGATNAVVTVYQTGNYSFTAINPGGCILVSDTVTVTVNQVPNANIITAGSGCAGTAYSAAVQSCAGCIYQWTLDGNPAGNGNQIAGTAGSGPLTPGTHTLIVSVTNPSFCVSKDTLIFSVFSLPTVSIAVANNPAQLCSGNVYLLTATGNAAGPLWSWHFNNAGSVLSNSNFLNASAAGNYSVSVTSSVTGCSSSATQLILPSPELDLFPIGCDSLCDTSHVFLPLPSLNGNISGYTINWYDNAPPYGTPIGSGPSFSLTSLPPGNHNLSVIATAANGCSDTSKIYELVTFNCLTIVAVRSLEVTVRQAGPYAVVEWETGSETDNDHFIAERSADGIHFSFAGKVMSKGNSTVRQYYQLNDPIQVFNRPLYYRIRSVDKQGAFFNSAVVKLNPFTFDQSSLIAMPNVTSGITQLYLFSTSEIKTSLVIYSADGKRVFTQPVKVVKGTNMFMVNMASLRAGLYFAAVQTGGKILKVPLIRQ